MKAILIILGWLTGVNVALAAESVVQQQNQRSVSAAAAAKALATKAIATRQSQTVSSSPLPGITASSGGTPLSVNSPGWVFERALFCGWNFSTNNSMFYVTDGVSIAESTMEGIIDTLLPACAHGSFVLWHLDGGPNGEFDQVQGRAMGQ